MTDTDIAELILAHEGSTFTNDPADAGGPTRYGVTRPMLALFRGVPLSSITIDDIRKLTRGEAIALYIQLSITPFRMVPDILLRVNCIDMGVNAGIETSGRLLQMTVGAAVDGILGPETVRLAAARDWNPLYVGVRLSYYERLIIVIPSNHKWRAGWRNRALSFLSPVGQQMTYLETRRATHARAARFGRMAKAYGLMTQPQHRSTHADQ